MEFLRARLDEDCLAVTDVHHANCEKIDYLASERTKCDCGWPGQLARVVEAKRKLLDEHADNGGYRRAEGGSLVRSGPVGDRCLTCVDDSSLITGGVTEFTMMASWPCRTARLLASEWDTHEDYREEWRP